jgi:hypothetical protein
MKEAALRLGRGNGALLFITGILAAFFSTVRIFDPDTWFHLAGGRLIWESGLPRVNTFSSTFPDYPWKNVEWLFDAAAYVTFRIAGFTGLELLQVLLVAGAFLLAVACALRAGAKLQGAGALLAFPVLILALSVCRFRFPLRPHLASWVGIALLLLLWRIRPRRLPLWFALAGMVWANLHPGVIYGVALGVIFVLASLLDRDREGTRTALLGLSALVGGSLANPWFIEPYRYDLANLSIKGAIPNILECLPPSPAGNESFFLYLALLLAAAPLRVLRRDWVHLLALALFLPFALLFQREIPNLVMVTLPGMLVSASEAANPARRGGMRILVAGIALLLLAATPVLSWHEWKESSNFFSPGWGVNHAAVPQGAVEFVTSRGLRGEMYNDTFSGGYLLWSLYPGRRVFIDGRVYAYPLSFHRQILEMTADRWPLLAERYGLTHAVLLRIRAGGFNNADFFSVAGWKLVYLDGSFLVFADPASTDYDLVRRDEFRFIGVRSDSSELYLAGRRDPQGMKAELSRIDSGRLVFSGDFHRFGFAAWGAGDLPSAERFFRRGAGRWPRDPVWNLCLGEVLLDAGRRQEAMRELASASRKGRGSEVGREAEARLRELGR